MRVFGYLPVIRVSEDLAVIKNASRDPHASNLFRSQRSFTDLHGSEQAPSSTSVLSGPNTSVSSTQPFI